MRGAGWLFQLGELGLGLVDAGEVGVGVFPEREEVVIGGLRFDHIALQGVGAGEAEMGQLPLRRQWPDAAMVQTAWNSAAASLGLRSCRYATPRR